MDLSKRRCCHRPLDLLCPAWWSLVLNLGIGRIQRLRCDFNEFYSNSFNSISKILVGIRVAQFAIHNWGVAVKAFDRSHWAAVCRISVAMHDCDGCGLPSPTSHGTGNGFCSLSCSDVVSIINADTLNSLPAWKHTTMEFGLLQFLTKTAKHPRAWSTHVHWNNTHIFFCPGFELSSNLVHNTMQVAQLVQAKPRSWFSALSLNPRNDPSEQRITRRCQELRPFCHFLVFRNIQDRKTWQTIDMDSANMPCISDTRRMKAEDMIWHDMFKQCMTCAMQNHIKKQLLSFTSLISVLNYTTHETRRGSAYLSAHGVVGYLHLKGDPGDCEMVRREALCQKRWRTPSCINR